MKKTLIWFLLAFINIFIFSFIFNGWENAYTAPSKYEGKIVKEIRIYSISQDKSGKTVIGKLKTIDEDELLSDCLTYKGLPLNSKEVRQDIEVIFKKGKFSNVQVEVEEDGDGVRVRFLCQERPIIKEIKFKGLSEVNETELRQFLMFKENDPLREDLVEISIGKLKSKYIENGYFNAHISYKISINDDNEARIDYIIDEGEDIKVAKFSILGCKNISDTELKRFVLTKEKGYFSGGEFKEFEFDQDKQKILAYYKHKGFLDAEIVEEKVEYKWKDPEEKLAREIYITLKMYEGEKYYFDGYTVAGNTIFTTEELTSVFKLGKPPRQGSEKLIKNIQKLMSPYEDNDVVFDDLQFQQDRASISFRYSSKGYIFARIIPKKTVTERVKDLKVKKEKRKYVKFDFMIYEGKQAYVENIIIKGNTKTKEKVIRREVLLKEGELFNSAKMQYSRERIYALGFFKEVNVDLRPGSRDDQMNLIISVEEQPTGTISLGGGYSTGSGFSIFATVGEKNWNGNAQNVNVRVEYGPLRSSVSLNFEDPWFMDKPVGFDASIFYNLYTVETSSLFSSSDEDAIYKKQSFGYSLGLSKSFLLNFKVGTRWTHSFQTIMDASGNCSDDVFNDKSRGIQEKRTITAYILRNTRNHPLSPTKGSYLGLSTSFVGGYYLGGDDHYIKYKPDFYFYFSPFHLPFLDDYPCVVELRANGVFLTPPLERKKLQGVQNRFGNDWLEDEDRLYLGGPETLRAWDPLTDDDFPESWQIRQYHRITYGGEFRVPIHTQFLWFVFYFDAGSLWTDRFWSQTLDDESKQTVDTGLEAGEIYDIRDINDADLMDYFKYSWGMGFKINVPMMPLRFWFGKKMKWTGADNGYFKEISNFKFQFAIGDMRF